jgi:hypothetical protein
MVVQTVFLTDCKVEKQETHHGYYTFNVLELRPYHMLLKV